jgi:hypothetical protein
MLNTIVRKMIGCCSLAMLLASDGRTQDLSTRFEDFTVDPHWQSYRSQLLPKTMPVVRQDFGLTKFQGHPALGGWVQRSLTPAWFAKVIPGRTLNDKFSASGKFAVTNDSGGSGMLFGWFNDKSRGWRTPNSLVFRIDGNGGRYWLFYEYGTRHWLTGGAGCFQGDRYQTTKTKPFSADGSVHTWSLNYDPEGNKGQGLITFLLDGTTYLQPLLPGHKEDGAEFNRFGMFNLQTTGSGLETFFTDLILDGKQIDLSHVAGWEAQGNKAKFEDRHLRPYHDFGWMPSGRAGGKPGEVGGIIWRDEAPAYYASQVGPLTLDDELTASGKFSFNAAGSDSGVYLGWFDSRSKTNKASSDHEQPQRNILAILIEGPSRIGHYFRPQYQTSSGDGEIKEGGPIIHPDGLIHYWSITYSPRGANGNGAIDVQLDGKPETLALKPGHRKQGASFDRFGLFNLQVGGHFVDIAVDDIRYSTDSGRR